MTVFHPFPFKSGRILATPYHLLPVLSWVAWGYLWLSQVLPHLTLNPPFVSSYLEGFTCAVMRQDWTKAIIAIHLLSVVLMFCSVYLMFKVMILYFWVLTWCFGCCFHVLLRVFHVFVLEWFWFLSKYDLKRSFIIHSNQSWISVQIALKLICEPSSYFICQFCNRLLIKT